MANPDKQSPGLIQVQISLSQEAPRFKETIKRATKRHELVEVDDFVFRRKRHAVVPSPAAAQAVAAAAAAAPQVAPHDSPAAAIKHGLQLECQSPRAAASRDDAAAMADQAGQTSAPAPVDAAAATALAAASPAIAAAAAQQSHECAADVAADGMPAAEAQTPAAEAAPKEHVEPTPLQFTVAPSELCDLVEWVFFNERKKVPGTTADAARTAAAQFKEQFAGLLQQHTAAKAVEQQAEGVNTAVAPQLTVLPYLLAQQKAVLQEKRDMLLQEEAHWLQLRQQYNDLRTTPSGTAVDTSTSAAAEATVETEAADCEAAAVAAAGAQPGTAAGPSVSTPSADAASAAAIGPVCAEQEGKIRSVQLKVEMLVALVSKMEHLVSSAESVARTLQAGYHSEKFKVFPHINSPAALIKSIISSQQPGSATEDSNAN